MRSAGISRAAGAASLCGSARAARHGLRRCLGALVAAALGTGGGGCGHAQSVADRQIAELRSEIARVQAEHDRLEERLGVLEASQRAHEPEPRATKPIEVGSDSSHPGAPAASLDQAAPSRLSTVSADGADENSSSADDGSARPMIQASGGRGPGAGRSPPAMSTAALQQAKRDYQRAMAFAKAKQHDKAIDAWTAFLVRHPDHPDVDGAMYWRGESLFARGEFARAAQELEGLLARFPFGSRAPDALLKLGLCQQQLGQNEQAEQTFAQVRDRYPNSGAARQLTRR